MIHTIVGLENITAKWDGAIFNFIMSNGDRTAQRYARDPTNYSHTLFDGADKIMRSVDIHHFPEHITGFSFFDKDEALLWEIGLATESWMKVETVVISDNEVIVGVVAKLCDG